MKIKYLYLTLLLLCPASKLFSMEEISEKKLLEMIFQKNDLETQKVLELWQNESNYLSSLVQVYNNKLIFTPEIYSTVSYAETKEKALISFQPVFSPSRFYSVGLQQLLPYGVSWNLYGSSLVQDAEGTNSASSFKHASTTTLGLKLEIDLWSDFLGRGIGNLLNESNLVQEQAVLEKNNNDKRLAVEIRQLYWSIVATNESIELMGSLIEIAQKQFTESQKRRRNSLADADEVSRYEAQLLGRMSELNFKQFQKEKMLQELQRRISSLQNQELKFKPEDIAKTQLEVMSCIKTISEIQDLPIEATNLDEQATILSEIQALQTKRYSRQSNIHLKLFGGIRSTGVDSNLVAANQYEGSQSDSWNDMYHNDRLGTEVGLKFSMPLGGTASALQESQSRLAYLNKEVQIKQMQESLMIHHQQFKRMIKLLENGVASQDSQTKSLKNVISSMQQKYRQARVSLTDLLQNQDAHYQAELRTIDARLEILMYLLDYLKLFPETKCAFNKY